MLIEQAFLALPEILHGSGYQDQDYEAGLVNAFSLALLQVLNGRNAPNPIGCLQHERPYRKGGDFPGYAAKRHLRSDLFLTTQRLRVASKRLSQYGWRHDAWMEAKFLRKGAGDQGDKHSGNKSTYVAAFLADLIRLITLVPEGADKSRSARYFLHVYDADPKYYLTLKSRVWLKSLIQGGTANINLSDFDKLPDTLKKLLGDLPGLKIEAKLTNFGIRPTDEKHRPVYHCYLTRLDSFVCTLGQHVVTLHPDRRMEQAATDSVAQIAAFVAERLSIQKGSKELQPPPEVDAEDQDTDLAEGAEAAPSES